MPVQPVNPFVLRESVLSIAADDFAKHISGCTISPQGGTPTTWQGLKPDATFSASTTPTWQVQIDYAQDWNSATSLSRYLWEHEGETVPMTFEPVAGGTGFMADVIITPGAIGGQVNSVGTASVTLGCVARPELIPAA